MRRCRYCNGVILKMLIGWTHRDYTRTIHIARPR